MASWKELWERKKAWWLGAAAGAFLGCLYRLILDSKWGSQGNPFPLIMTVGFLTLVPLCMGYIAVENYLRDRPIEGVRWHDWFFLPQVSVLLTMAVSVIVKWEGAICLIFAAPIMVISATIGGIIARLTRRRFRRRGPSTVCAVTLPLLAILLESQISSPLEVRSVETDLLVHAPAAVVWDNIKSVRAIAPSELPQSWVTRIGFPTPVAATLSHEGIGGVREASFTGGLLFTETVNAWTPESDLRFSIRANTQSIPKSTLDEHVTIGGALFDVLDGEYRLEPRADGVLLRLISHERLSTHLNPYAGVWTDAVMRSIQNQILQVIRKRCEENAGDSAFDLTNSN